MVNNEEMDLQQLKVDAAAGKLSVEKLIDLIVAEQKVIAALQKRVAELEELTLLNPENTDYRKLAKSSFVRTFSVRLNGLVQFPGRLRSRP